MFGFSWSGRLLKKNNRGSTQMKAGPQDKDFPSVGKTKDTILRATVEIYKHKGLAQGPMTNHSTHILQELHH